MTQNFTVTAADIAAQPALLSVGQGGAVNYFTNGFSSVTQGIDLVGTYRMGLVEPGDFNLTLAYNFNRSRVTHVDQIIAARPDGQHPQQRADRRRRPPRAGAPRRPDRQLDARPVQRAGAPELLQQLGRCGRLSDLRRRQDVSDRAGVQGPGDGRPRRRLRRDQVPDAVGRRDRTSSTPSPTASPTVAGRQPGLPRRPAACPTARSIRAAAGRSASTAASGTSAPGSSSDRLNGGNHEGRRERSRRPLSFAAPWQGCARRDAALILPGDLMHRTARSLITVLLQSPPRPPLPRR